jgi:hypothetical protein
MEPVHFVGGQVARKQDVDALVVEAMKDHKPPTAKQMLVAVLGRLGLLNDYEAPDGSRFRLDANGDWQPVPKAS